MPESSKPPTHGVSESRRRGLLWWMPPSLAAFIYTVLLKPPPLRALAQKLICLFIPKELKIRGISLTLNTSDAIVSGNLALGCYEAYNLEFFESLLRPGMCVFDVGANIGLYSAIAASCVGRSGKVVSVEPDPTNCSFIRKTIERNDLTQITVIQKAAGDRCGPSQLFLCDSNKADHRVYDPAGTRQRLPIEMTTLDALLIENGIASVDVLKIDTQGSEPLVFQGMRELLRRSPTIKILMEFWPWGILQAGGSPSHLLDDFVSQGFTISEIDSDRKQIRKLHDTTSIAKSTLERQHTNLYLERQP